MHLGALLYTRPRSRRVNEDPLNLVRYRSATRRTQPQRHEYRIDSRRFHSENGPKNEPGPIRQWMASLGVESRLQPHPPRIMGGRIRLSRSLSIEHRLCERTTIGGSEPLPKFEHAFRSLSLIR